jgi:hypothetical protein
MPIELVHGSVRPWYHQFYVTRRAEPSDTDIAGLIEQMGGYNVVEGDGFAVIATFRYGGVGPIVVEVHDDEPTAPPLWQRTVTCSLGGDGDNLLVQDWDGPGSFSVPVPDEPLRMRVMWQGLHQGEWDQNPEVTSEIIGIQVWPAAPAHREIERRWFPWDPPPYGLPASVHRLHEQPSWRVLPLWFRREDAPVLPQGDGAIYSLIVDRETHEVFADGEVEGREVVVPLTEDEAREIAAASGPWRLLRGPDGELRSLPPDAYATEAHLRNVPQLEERLLELDDPGLLGQELGLLTTIDPVVVDVLARLGVEALIVDEI